jgi:hypothetical protein
MSTATSTISRSALRAGAQHAQRHLGAVRVRDGRALVHGELGGERELAAQGSDDQETHFSGSFIIQCKVSANGEW